MCGACGSAGGTRDWYARGIADSPTARKRAQLALVSWASRLFAPEGIRVHETPGTVRVLVTGPTGRSRVAQGVDGVLDAVDAVGSGGTDWSAVADRIRAADPDSSTDTDTDTDWARRGFASALARRRGALA
jgi:hypothetical protein